MPLVEWIEKVPGGVLIIPLFATSLVNTFFPGALNIGAPTTSLFTSTGSMTLIGGILFIAGTQLKLSDAKGALMRGVVFLAMKIFLGLVACILVTALCGDSGFLGISAMALTVALMSGNTGVYLSLVHTYGDSNDVASAGIMNLETIPSLPIIILCFSSGASLDWLSLVSALIPFTLGAILGNIDREFERFAAPAMKMLLLFLGCTFGSNIDLVAMLQAGPQGVLLAAIYLAVSLPIFYMLDRFVLKRKGYAGLSFCSVAGITVMIPNIAAQIMPQLQSYAAEASLQLALAMTITTIAMPIVVKCVMRKRFGEAEQIQQRNPDRSDDFSSSFTFEEHIESSVDLND